jgi:hypothetical protein
MQTGRCCAAAVACAKSSNNPHNQDGRVETPAPSFTKSLANVLLKEGS